ncbi:uncharacterized protein B4U80_03057, partial [Leptotrombidium deliense]
MSKNLKNCAGKLQFIASIKDKKLMKALLKDKCDDCLYKAINEIAYNTRKNHLPLTEKQIKQLEKSKKLITKVSKRTKNEKLKRKLVVQSVYKKMEFSEKLHLNSEEKKNIIKFHEKLIRQLKIILKFAKINAYDENGRIRNQAGNFIPNSSIIQLLNHAMTVSRVLLAENEFIDLLLEADIDPDMIINDNVRSKLMKLKQQRLRYHENEPKISEVNEAPVNQPVKRKRIYTDYDDELPDLEKYDEPPLKRTKAEADQLEMPRGNDQAIGKFMMKMMNEDHVKLLKFIYYDPQNPGAFSTAEKLFEKAKLHSPTLTLNDVKEWLSGELTYTLHKPARRHFKRNRIIVEGIDEQWQADLVDMQQFQNQNDGNKYILTVIDVFSKYAWAEPVKNKSANNIVKAFAKIYKDRIPFYLQTDKGKEFMNTDFKKLMKKFNIIHFT